MNYEFAKGRHLVITMFVEMLGTLSKLHFDFISMSENSYERDTSRHDP